MSLSLDIPLHLALALLLATGEPLPAHVDRRVLEPARAQRGQATPRAGLGFSEDGWLAAVRGHGAACGLGDLAQRIFRTSSGRVYAPTETDRRAIVGLAAEPAVAACVTITAARAHAERLAAMTGRPARPAELYAAHVMGIEAAETLVRAAAATPDGPAAEHVPEAALAEPALFFRGVRPRTPAEVIAEIDAALTRALPLTYAAAPARGRRE